MPVHPDVAIPAMIFVTTKALIVVNVSSTLYNWQMNADTREKYNTFPNLPTVIPSGRTSFTPSLLQPNSLETAWIEQGIDATLLRVAKDIIKG